MTRLQYIVAPMLTVLLVSCGVASSDTSPSQSVETTEFTGERVRLIGRFDQSEPGEAVFSWPASAIDMRFSGTRLALDIRSEQRVRFQVNVDDQVGTELWVEPGRKRYTLADGLPKATHRVRLTRLGESFEGRTTLVSDPITDGRLLLAPEGQDRHLLVLGDSITAGYGVEGESEACPYSQQTSSPLLTYAAVAASSLNADFQAIAWSGIGVWRSYGEQAPEQPTLTDRYPRVVALDETPVWNPASYPADVIVITLGTNDYWTGEAPGYRAGMKRLIERVRKDYSDVPLYLIASPMMAGEARTAQVNVLRSLTGDRTHFLDLGGIEAADGYGCDYHPNTNTHQRMGEKLSRRLQQDLGW
ncbi:SGNH/GDSL hydrolase family protein [Marinimicrobium sp. ARAG 43.8]|uniref:SGNH/GDSL hydrolase family protein n=1 Tax=Marinimicrobium sp. ARAG 43.8 TaxID=3418719 RepID=UPI003CF07D65